MDKPTSPPRPAPNLHDSIQFVKGVGPTRTKIFRKLGIFSIEDALHFLPRRYEDRRVLKTIGQLEAGKLETFIGVVRQTGFLKTRGGKRIFQVLFGDETGYIAGKWFTYNEEYMTKRFQKGAQVIVSGQIQVNFYGGPRIELYHPDVEMLGDDDQPSLHVGRIVPVYPATEGINQKAIRSILKTIVDTYANQVPDILPNSLREKKNLVSSPEALKEVHLPPSEINIDDLQAGLTNGYRRLIFEEFFLLELGLALRKGGVTAKEKGIAFHPSQNLVRRLRTSLPFKLTAAQERTFQEILHDMTSPYPMNRLLHGDVGSGKTIVALMAMLVAIESGYQTAIMAPTEILAEQHYLTIHQMVNDLGVKTALLIGGPKTRRRDLLLDEIAQGHIDIVIGTHALIQEGVAFHKLGLVIIDEQHRFGVLQRATLREKGYNPDVLVMTATPIPRTLALTVYGDLEISTIDELPSGRLPIKTIRAYESRRREIYSLIRNEIGQGRQVYIVYPLVEESEKVDLKAAAEMMEHLQRDIFPDLSVGLIHGRMKSEEKEAIMAQFKAGEIKILVSTTVIEVGVDVPNASVMVIEHAERFGLAQLHQLRGRIGRGTYQSYCILIVAFPISEEAKERLRVMVESSDGFYIAERDLELRGPGEFFGTKQSG
ncbi:MAG: ATP-dependent DNA helicase RecG, partial [Candidatus Tectomicrobia bacterium]|nr:ATP-dependent DNA helicase RecG [Candidatus Tectomicrobia bacterium]